MNVKISRTCSQYSEGRVGFTTHIAALVGIFTDTGKFLQHFLRYQRSDVAHQRVSALGTGRHVGPTLRADHVAPGTLVYGTTSGDSQAHWALQQVLQVIFLDQVICQTR